MYRKITHNRENHGRMKLQYDSEKFNALIRRYYFSLVNFADNIVKSREDAEDIVQNLFVKIWEEQSLPDNEKAVGSYLYASVKNLSLNCLRDNERLKLHHSQFVMEIAGEKSLREKVIEEESYRLLRGAIRQLPERSALLMTLTLQGLSQEEIGKRMDISLSSVKSMKAYAIQKLRKVLDPKTFLFLLMLLAENY